MCDCDNNPLNRRPIPEAAEAVAALCEQIGAVIASLASGDRAIGIKLVPKLFPTWEIEIRLK